MSEQTTYTEHIYEDSDMDHEYYHIIPFGSMREEIVRCRDCKWCISYWSSVYCNRFNCLLPDSDLDGFCKWGERRNK